MTAAAPEPRAGATDEAAGGAVPPALRAQFHALGFSDAACADLAAWRDLLAVWSARINLVGPGELAGFWERHALDSAQIFPLAPASSHPAPARWIDLGAGAGFPGIAIAIAQKHASDKESGGEVLLVESAGKKAAFLREVVRRLGLKAQVADCRCEDVPAEIFDVVTARAFAPLPRLLAAAHRFWGPETIGLFPKGKGVDAEIRAAERDWRFRAEPVRSITGDGAILRVTELAPK